MRKIFITTLLLLFIHSIYAQTSQHDSLKSLIRSAKDDSTKFYGTAQLIWGYIYTNMDSATVYIRQNILLAKNMKSNVALDNVYWQYWTLQSLNGNYSESLQYRIRSLRLAEQRGDLITICVRYNGLGDTYREIGDFEKSIYYHRKAKA
ncbi:MAG TPA: tetratricopeptide repeat protein, partial [Spirosoma sp.]|nr:tetratricopeptide repeat protein [Spirosoma sp.]